MFNKKNLILITILAILALGAYLYTGPYQTWQAKKQTADSANWLAVTDMNLIDKIEATDKDGKAYWLKKINNEWKIEPNNWPTEKIVIDALNEKLAKLTKDELEIVSFNKDNQEKFDLGKNGLRVKLFQGDKEAGNFIIGKIASDYASTYIGRENDERTYRAHDTFVRAFDVESWRDNTVLDLTAGDIETVVWQYPAQIIEITNKPDKRGETYWHASPTLLRLSKDKVEGFLNNIVKLEASAIPEQNVAGTGLDKPSLQLRLAGKGVEETLLVGNKDSKTSEYFVQKKSTGQIFLTMEEKRKELEKQIKDLQ
ncbi:hypothetical protein COU00_03400 [Candidatus Falkowbacteria bacterium CG10_big_fil_rev_8_21_14_0_10_43_11]|uniref:DUF4340 domain-containing protein n=1 Tax=Candidatus Falkowbacteria bacterium CG10_big_fil_rev_8_21_14_0_10_43_11 TaxID=1974568 RepID=A0A2M6WLE5_9BACT|nr:MAG: hypothetical protein COU00_03400 [Candidatus Falkowbacteria bacterium CG10_big_fil_rev_8_21_14_0_10_43_11]